MKTKKNMRTGISSFAGFGLRAFSSDDLESIHEATLHILRHTGIKVISEEAVEIFHGAGAFIEQFDGHAVVKFPEYVVENCISSSPSTTVYWGRNKELSFFADPHRVGFVTFGGCIKVIDPLTKKVRPATREDVGGFAKVCDYLDEISVVERSVNATDAPHGTLSVVNIKEMLANTSKHIFLGADSARSLQVMRDLAAVCAGGRDAFLEHPIFTPIACPESPLMLSEVVCEVIMAAARMGIGLTILPMGLSGGTSPATLAGALVTHNAEVLSGLILAQLTRKGTPCMYSSTSAILDLKLGTSAIGAPEFGMINASIAKLAQFYHLPSWVGGGASDSKLPDIQSGYEFTLSATLSALAGANLVFGCGVLEQGLTMDYAKLIMDAEMIRMIHTARRGVAVSDETLALDVINEVGPAGPYIAHKHTYQHMKEQSQPRLFDRRSREGWMTAKGGRTIQEEAYETAINILENHEPMSLPDGAAEEMERIVREFQREVSEEKR
jgi:trimethylamine---corrinoid protein Co-methyltransferase